MVSDNEMVRFRADLNRFRSARSKQTCTCGRFVFEQCEREIRQDRKKKKTIWRQDRDPRGLRVCAGEEEWNETKRYCNRFPTFFFRPYFYVHCGV